jgi:hypothetical protein
MPRFTAHVAPKHQTVHQKETDGYCPDSGCLETFNEIDTPTNFYISILQKSRIS